MKKAFTLSEVLIALTIIGVIAAMTIPVLMANTRREEASAKIKKAYSGLCQASMKAKAAGKNWEYVFEESGITSSLSLRQEFMDSSVLPYLSYTETELTSSYYRAVLADGTFLQVTAGGSCIDFTYDINGERKPNTYGRDMFRFLFCPLGSSSSWIQAETVIPYCPKSIETRDEAMAYCKSTPLSCSCLLSIDGWEFKKDYPFNM